MPTVTMTFVQATYLLATFVYISNISAVTDLILTKFFGPNFWGLLLLSKNFFLPNFFFTKYSLNQICFLTQHFRAIGAFTFVEEILFWTKLLLTQTQGQGQGKVWARSKQGQGKVKVMSRPCQGHVKAKSMQG